MFRFEYDNTFEHADGCRIECAVDASDLADHGGNLRNSGDRFINARVDPHHFRQPSLRQHRRHGEERTFIERRHELSTNAGQNTGLAHDFGSDRTGLVLSVRSSAPAHATMYLPIALAHVLPCELIEFERTFAADGIHHPLQWT